MRKVELCIILVVLVILSVAVCGCEDEPAQGSVQSTQEWFFQGTLCRKCPMLYNLEEYPKICPTCNKETVNTYFLALFKKHEEN